MTTAMPPVGPLTSTENLLPGDKLRALVTTSAFSKGEILTYQGPGPLGECMVFGMSWMASRFAFVARPGVWMPWNGGKNPVPGMKVRVRGANATVAFHNAEVSDNFDWTQNGSFHTIREYMVIPDAEQPRKGDPVEPPFGCQPLPKGVSDRVMDAAMVDAGMMDHRNYVKAHGVTSAQPEQKSAESPVDTKTAAADAVRAAAKALNDAMTDARRQDVMTSLSVQQVVPRGQAIIVNCTTRV